MQLAQTLLALLFAGVINLQAQATLPEYTTNEVAWLELRKIHSKTASPDPEPTATPEAVAIRDAILAGPTVTALEGYIVTIVTEAHGGEQARNKMMRALASSKKTGVGVIGARATVKRLDGDTEGWTSEMIEVAPEWAADLAMRANAGPAFKAAVWAVIRDNNALKCPAFFKAHRGTLPKAEQLAVTQKQKDLMLAIPARDNAANAWLAEMSADLVALQLDQ